MLSFLKKLFKSKPEAALEVPVLAEAPYKVDSPIIAEPVQAEITKTVKPVKQTKPVKKVVSKAVTNTAPSSKSKTTKPAAIKSSSKKPSNSKPKM